MVSISNQVRFATTHAVVLFKSKVIAVSINTSFPLIKGGLNSSARRVTHIVVTMSVYFVHSLRYASGAILVILFAATPHFPPES